MKAIVWTDNDYNGICEQASCYVCGISVIVTEKEKDASGTRKWNLWASCDLDETVEARDLAEAKRFAEENVRAEMRRFLNPVK